MEPDPNRNADRTPDPAAPSPAARFAADVAALCELVDLGIEVDGEATVIEGERWVVYGRTSYDGEIVLAQYDDEAEATAVLRAMPRHRGEPT